MKQTLLFYAKAPMNVVMFRPIVERLAGDPRLELRFTGHPSREDSLRQIYGKGGLPGVPIVPAWRARWMSPDLYISPDMMRLAKRARRSIQIYHGVSFKGRMYDPKVLAYDKLFLVGEDMRQRYLNRGILTEDDPRLERIGMPKLDRLLDGSLDREAILRGLNLDSSRKTVLYAPTWRPEASLYTLGPSLMRELADERVNLMIKLHDLAFERENNPVDWLAELPGYERENVRAIREFDLTPCLFAADVLITDASSAANEFTLLDRPIIFIDTPKLFRVYRDTIDLEGWGRKTGEVVKDMDELRGALNRAMESPAERGEVRRAAAADFFYNPGKATEAAVEAIYRILDLKPP